MKGAIECSQACEESSSNFGSKEVVMSLECSVESQSSRRFNSHVNFEGKVTQVNLAYEIAIYPKFELYF